ncbi:hypothetical protein BKP45_03485 [Anaerobacillus alkalidiazotrophicus]|uniref:TATA-box binding protein n=1 Tax=Anaerobacillus alkalidiazotrophicus TaxID=472963 RepID=A0A1S2MAH1_9BACI|nr:YwmB family TATA-box binding protein [Anaerobacillus alkalidiazotrophicus]OIJ21772.1 hypothetical protein BKP45_03485 [Anaerobacillus alkalidiazotrophicus]
MGNKNKLHIIFFGIVFFSLYYLGLSEKGEATVENLFSELNQIVDVMDKHDIELTEWTLYTRGQLNHWTEPGEYEKELKTIQQMLSHFDWEPLKDYPKDQKKAIGTFIHHDIGVTQTLTYIVYPHNKQLHSYLIYEVQGVQTLSEKQLDSLTSVVLFRHQDLFNKNTKIFTCATGNGSDKLNLGLGEQAELLLKEFSAQKIEALKEETFISISAYTNIWNSSLTTTEESMNLQLAIRANERLGGETTVTIGTPIITTEY